MAEIILALDVASADDACRLLDRLPGLRWVKVGSVLMTREGAPLVAELRARGLQVFLDLKWHDIPNTVAGAVEAAAGLGVAMATVHALGGQTMLRAAQVAAGGRLGLVGVTVLTSHSAEEYAAAVGRGAGLKVAPVQPGSLDAEVARLAALATAAGLRGVVCSPREIEIVLPQLPPGAWVVVPGIRRAGDAAGDQVRTATPQEAVRRGATHLVVGRPILNAAAPAQVLAELLAEVEGP
jgi:orotidine-5'-phosphate decarboxylase